MKKVFISFDYDKDRNYRYLLSAFNKNPEISLVYADHTPNEILSNDIGRIKAVLTSKIRSATHTLVLIGEDANKKHKSSQLIGEVNWQHWEVARSIQERKKIIAVKLAPSLAIIPVLNTAKIKWVSNFTVPGISNAIMQS